MKCGVKLNSDQVFCDSCLAEMERYPVASSTAVHLPRRRETEAPKKTAPRKKTAAPEETVAKLRKAVIWLVGLVLILAIALGVTVTMLVQNLQSDQPDETIGKNYSTISPNDPT